jgi:hypothetical protein
MQKKVELMVGNRKIRCMEHMVAYMIQHGATREKRILKDVPKELLKVPDLKKVDPLPNMKTEAKAPRKAPVRSKAKK